MEEKTRALELALLQSGDFTGLRKELSEWNEVDIADFLEELEPKDMIKVFRILPKDISAEVFSYLESDNQESIVASITNTELRALVDDLYLDDVVDFLEEVPANVVTRVLRVADADTRKEINTFLNYPEDSAGSIMTNEMITLHDNMTVRDAIRYIRATGEDKVSIYTVYCIDATRHLIGTIELADLIYHSSDTLIRDIMDDEKQLIYVRTLDDQEEVAKVVKHYDLLSVPVVDKEDRLVGIVTVDDVIDILQEEATEDIEKMAAITPTDKPYLRTGIFETYKARMPWLLLLMISATFTGAIITRFEDALAAFVVLTAYIPMLMDTGGNSGSQASVSVIRALSLGDVEFRDWFRVIWKEIRVAVICGLTLAAANFLKLMFFDHLALSVALVVCVTLALVVLVAKCIGCTLPMLAYKVGLDPAVMASPFITTLVDAVALFTYFKLAVAMLHL
ncbi:MAG: magnesium transporter [Clostridia bacterium]|nr:magnesium transporter [Clostridia bacterium]